MYNIIFACQTVVDKGERAAVFLQRWTVDCEWTGDFHRRWRTSFRWWSTDCYDSNAEICSSDRSPPEGQQRGGKDSSASTQSQPGMEFHHRCGLIGKDKCC